METVNEFIKPVTDHQIAFISILFAFIALIVSYKSYLVSKDAINLTKSQIDKESQKFFLENQRDKHLIADQFRLIMQVALTLTSNPENINIDNIKKDKEKLKKIYDIFSLNKEMFIKVFYPTNQFIMEINESVVEIDEFILNTSK